MEAQADKVTLLAQLLSNCALVDRMTARRGRRAIWSLLKGNQGALSDRSQSSDEETTLCDNSEVSPRLPSQGKCPCLHFGRF